MKNCHRKLLKFYFWFFFFYNLPKFSTVFKTKLNDIANKLLYNIYCNNSFLWDDRKTSTAILIFLNYILKILITSWNFHENLQILYDSNINYFINSIKRQSKVVNSSNPQL